MAPGRVWRRLGEIGYQRLGSLGRQAGFGEVAETRGTGPGREPGHRLYSDHTRNTGGGSMRLGRNTTGSSKLIERGLGEPQSSLRSDGAILYQLRPVGFQVTFHGVDPTHLGPSHLAQIP